MDVLVIGYGKIGRIKAFIWQSLGRHVSVYDVDIRKQHQAESDGFRLYEESESYEDLIVDISTPASFHLQSLEWTLEHIKPLPRGVLIEKPLASDEAELEAIRVLLTETELADFKERIVVNESYYLSSALAVVAEDIARQNLKVLEVTAELSKNRLADVASGRFVDAYLGSLGIELPHMIAVVQGLGFELADLNISKSTIYIDADVAHNEGFVIKLSASNTLVTLKSFLGDFRVDNQSISSNLAVVRSLEVKTELRDYVVSFDPVEGLERYKAQVTVLDCKGDTSETKVIDDDHLAANLKKLHEHSRSQSIDTLLSVDNSLKVSRLIFALRENTQYQEISTLREKSAPVALQAQPIMEGTNL
ncbi:MAG TPA: Gfo/Idh/MocA family oxidoreductase [Candidatus Saccharimonadales bacterium]|nr:Gfo/Idh/MocA family oxidoreductase [Candidatus Saccharimonadales bacterium]